MATLLNLLCITVITVLLNMALTLMIFMPSNDSGLNKEIGPLSQSTRQSLSDLRRAEQSGEEASSNEGANGGDATEKQLSDTNKELLETLNELRIVKSQLYEAVRQVEQNAAPPPPPAYEECPESRAVMEELDTLRRSLEVEFGFRKRLEDNIDVSVTRTLTRNVVPIPRVDGTKLTYKDFFYKYAKKQRPVIITNYHDRMFAVNWTLDYLAEVCGDASVKLQHFDPKVKRWGNLVKDSQRTRVGDFIEDVKAGTAGNSYLFDWSIPRHCADLLDSYTVPKFFAPDYFQRLPADATGYQDTWPSLFIGTGATASGLHVDAAQSHFWMAMIEGRKRWAVITPSQVPLLYPVPESSVFEVKDIFDVNLTEFPLVSKATIWEDILGPGEIIYVPGGGAHQIKNLDTIVSISMNYLDDENFDRSLTYFKPDVQQLLRKNRGLTSRQADLPWKRFKTYPRGEVYDM